MKFTGTITELGLDVDDCDFDVRDAVVSRDRIAIDWEEDGQLFHAVLKSSDGTYFDGHYGSPQPNSQWTMQGTKYTAADKSVLLLVKWIQTDNGFAGWTIFELQPTD